MLGTHDLALFLVSGLLLNITPGPDTLYIVGRSSTQGLRAGMLAALGVGAGILVHTAAAAIGISALLLASASAFAVLKIVGVAYLVYLGVSLIRRSLSTPAPIPRSATAAAGLRDVFVQGFLTNVLNPKVALFFLAFLPQFVDSEAPDKPLALLFLGVLFNLNGTLWNLLVAWGAARIAGRVQRSAAISAWIDRCVGGAFVYLGIRVVLAREG